MTCDVPQVDGLALAIVVVGLAWVLSAGVRDRWRRRKAADHRPVDPYLGECIPPCVPGKALR